MTAWDGNWLELCGPQAPQVQGLGLPKVLLGLEEIKALAGLSPVCAPSGGLAELPGPFQLGHSKTL